MPERDSLASGLTILPDGKLSISTSAENKRMSMKKKRKKTKLFTH